MDKVTQPIRSQIMRSVRSTGNKSTELRFRSGLIRAGIRGWKIRPRMPFNPDFVFPVERIVIFVDGCFWHGCPSCSKSPKTNSEYWNMKISRNKIRDKKATHFLSQEGWNILRFWEHALKRDMTLCMNQTRSVLKEFSF